MEIRRSSLPIVGGVADEIFQAIGAITQRLAPLLSADGWGLDVEMSDGPLFQYFAEEKSALWAHAKLQHLKQHGKDAWFKKTMITYPMSMAEVQHILEVATVEDKTLVEKVLQYGQNDVLSNDDLDRLAYDANITADYGGIMVPYKMLCSNKGEVTSYAGDILISFSGLKGEQDLQIAIMILAIIVEQLKNLPNAVAAIDIEALLNGAANDPWVEYYLRYYDLI